jgi:thymidylate kinase
MNHQRARIVSFSGIDGAGKTTQIESFGGWLRASGLRVEVRTFWDDVAVFSHFREGVSRTIFRGDEGIGSPEKPLNRRDKNVVSWPVMAVRFILYFIDALNVGRKVRQWRTSDSDVVIVDRYLYDELANLPLQRSLGRNFATLILRFTPAPDVAYLIDADPVAARARKPEYPLEFIRKNRETYLQLARLASNMAMIEPLSMDAVQSRVRKAFLNRQSAPEPKPVVAEDNRHLAHSDSPSS